MPLAPMNAAEIVLRLAKIGIIIEKLADLDIFVWLTGKEPPTETKIHLAATYFGSA